MNLLLSVLFVISISSSHGQDVSSTTIDTSSSLQTSSGIGGGAEAQVFRDRFTESPELPGLPSNGTNSTDPDIGSSIGSRSVGFGSSIDNTSGSMSSSDDQVHSVGSDDEDNSVENDPTTSNGLDSSDSGSVLFTNDDTSASSNLDASSDASSTIAFFLAYSLAMIALTTIIVV